MSFILDALKKSEAERRQGEVPSLQNDIGSAAPRRRSIWPLVLTFALLLNGAVLGGWLLLRQEKPPVAATSSGEPDRILASRAGHAESTGDLTTKSAPVAKETELSAAAVKPITITDPPVQPAQATVSTRESVPVKQAGVTPQAKPKAAAPAFKENPAAASEEIGSYKTRAAQSVKSVKPEKPAQPAQSPTKRATVAAPAPAESFPLISELPADLRSGLPGLNLQLHFFSPDPARRLVRLNGSNLREGERGGDGLSVVEITPDGIRLTCRGVRFFLPTVRR
ncbi:general secretion pathway protein GspB [Desulfuromonas sp. TF]|uniref:general secretion pathway protein GspB n=1 Tax=Desulfuromonas sp. TF TaxID=1232410 RepID=UPI0004183E3E|nr:general secretion pathway protein GspB [Desulfuromonas sp. TF]